MRVITNILAAAFVLSALAVLGLWLMHYGENPKSHFATYDALAASELIDKGWLTLFLPKSITEISETHSIDSNRVWATFKYDARDIASIESACKRIVKSPEGAKYLCPPFEKQTTVLLLKADGTGSLETEPNEI